MTSPTSAERPEWRGAAAPFPPGSVRLQVEGLDASFVLVDGGPLADGFRAVLKGRNVASVPMGAAPPADDILAVAVGGPTGFTIHSRNLGEPISGLRAASAICGLVADLAESHYAGRAGWIGLHCGAIRAGGRIALVTGPARAGKSTLIGRLSAEPGIETICDDVLPVAPDGRVFALGIAPRLRLPLPPAAGNILRDHVRRHRVLWDRRYAYIMPPSLVPFGPAGRIAAIIVLDRRAGSVPAQLHRLEPAEAVGHLLMRQMADDAIAAVLLARAQKLAAKADCLRLVYSDIEEATALVTGQICATAGPDMPEVLPPLPAEVSAPEVHRTAAALPDGRLRQTTGATARRIGDDHFLCLPCGPNIVRLNPVGGAIWRILEEPRTATEVVDLLAMAFPEVGRVRIGRDVADMLARLLEAGLAQADETSTAPSARAGAVRGRQ